MSPIVRGSLETGLYKFTMRQALPHRHPSTHTGYALLAYVRQVFDHLAA